MESLFIQFSYGVYRSQFEKKLPMWLVLWYRFTYMIALMGI